ncbi:hypothetical protein HG531_011347 [Fusarium graminearum]|nr:hypothetical protein HG531_011347 [Fusarium graminearum]
MSDGAVVEDAAEEVDEHGDDHDETKDAARPNATGLVRLGVGASVRRPDFKEVGALVRVRANKGDAGRSRARISVAVERDGGRLASALVLGLGLLLHGLFGLGYGRVSGRIVVLVFKGGVALGGSLVDGFRLVNVGAAGGSAGVLKDQLAASALQVH